MEPHSLEHDGRVYEVAFEQTEEGWIAHIRDEDGAGIGVLAFPEGAGFDPDDVRASLIAGCRAALARHAPGAPTRH